MQNKAVLRMMTGLKDLERLYELPGHERKPGTEAYAHIQLLEALLAKGGPAESFPAIATELGKYRELSTRWSKIGQPLAHVLGTMITKLGTQPTKGDILHLGGGVELTIQSVRNLNTDGTWDVVVSDSRRLFRHVMLLEARPDNGNQWCPAPAKDDAQTVITLRIVLNEWGHVQSVATEDGDIGKTDEWQGYERYVIDEINMLALVQGHK